MSAKRTIRGNKRQTRAYICLGSNTGDRVGYVQQAMQLLKDIPQIKVIECSSLYETQPISRDSHDWFVNAAATIETNLTAQELVEVCKDIELRLSELHTHTESQSSRKSLHKRIINLDILFYGDQVIETTDLKIPHPIIDCKAYALVPLLEIAPELIHPKIGKSVAQLHEDLLEPELVYLYGTRESA